MQLYDQLSTIFGRHHELLSDFAVFFLPQQAKECGCFMVHQQYVRARTFLRKLEIHFRKLPGLLQRALNAFARWQSLATTSVADLEAEVKPLLKGNQYLIDEFATFFAERGVPDSHVTQFEDVTLPANEQEAEDRRDDVMEEVTLPECEKSKVLGSPACTCRCHTEESATAPFKKRSKHCYLCGIKVRDVTCNFNVFSYFLFEHFWLCSGHPRTDVPDGVRQTSSSLHQVALRFGDRAERGDQC